MFRVSQHTEITEEKRTHVRSATQRPSDSREIKHCGRKDLATKYSKDPRLNLKQSHFPTKFLIFDPSKKIGKRYAVLAKRHCEEFWELFLLLPSFHV